MNKVIYCDGSSDGKTGGKGGWGYVILVDGVKVYEANGSENSATNNSMEIRGAIEGLKYTASYLATKPVVCGALREVILRSDSQLMLGYASGRYRCKAMHLLPLYLELKKLFSNLNAKDEWVKGHAGDTYNEQCDKLAKAARESKDDKARTLSECEGKVSDGSRSTDQVTKKTSAKISWDNS